MLKYVLLVGSALTLAGCDTILDAAAAGSQSYCPDTKSASLYACGKIMHSGPNGPTSVAAEPASSPSPTTGTNTPSKEHGHDRDKDRDHDRGRDHDRDHRGDRGEGRHDRGERGDKGEGRGDSRGDKR
jgi:hypothetical protein